MLRSNKAETRASESESGGLTPFAIENGSGRLHGVALRWPGGDWRERGFAHFPYSFSRPVQAGSALNQQCGVVRQSVSEIQSERTEFRSENPDARFGALHLCEGLVKLACTGSEIDHLNIRVPKTLDDVEKKKNSRRELGPGRIKSYMIRVQTALVEGTLPERHRQTIDVKDEDAEPTVCRLDKQLISRPRSIEKAEPELPLDGIPRDLLHVTHGFIEFCDRLEAADVDPASESVGKFLVLAAQFGALARPQTLKERFHVLRMVQEPMASQLAAMISQSNTRQLSSNEMQSGLRVEMLPKSQVGGAFRK